MTKAIEKLKQKFEEDPITVIIVASLIATTAVKVAEGVASIKSKNAYAKQINAKIKK